MSITTWAATTGDWDDSKFSRGWDGPSISPAKGSIVLSSSAPTSPTGTMISVGSGAIQFVANYEWDSYSSSITWTTVTGDWDNPVDTLTIPSVAVGIIIQPDKNSFSLSSSAPSLDVLHLTYVPSGSMTTTMHTPYAVSGHFALVPSGALDINPENIRWDTITGDWESKSEVWDDFIDTRPSVGQTFSFDPSAYDAILSGQKPDAQHRAPKFIPPIQVL